MLSPERLILVHKGMLNCERILARAIYNVEGQTVLATVNLSVCKLGFILATPFTARTQAKYQSQTGPCRTNPVQITQKVFGVRSSRAF